MLASELMCLAIGVTDSPFCDRVRGGETVFGGWVGSSGQFTASAMAAGGLDYVSVDLQHGAATEHDLPAITAAIRLAGSTPLARVRHASQADIGRALDFGCEGVIVPQVETAEQAAMVAGACRFPPDGYRSAGVPSPLARPLCIVMIESAQAMNELPDILTLPDVDGIYVGPRDLSLSLGCQLHPEDPVLRPAFERIWAACAEAGKPVGVHASDGTTARIYRDNGCRLVTVIADIAALTRGAVAELGAARG
jgi:4-hydroxy-2-oxoheptanedioate aldolase